jgi:predicted phage terminase large subunit-like protein
MSTSSRQRFNRFIPKSEVEWLDHSQRKSHRRTIKTLTDIALTLEQSGELSPEQERIVRTVTAGSEARDTRLNAAWDLLERTEVSYYGKLAAMAPHDLTAYHELINPHEPPAQHHIFMCEKLMQVERGDIRTLIIALPPGAAKALRTRTIVKTTNGNKELGDIEVGDEVLTLEGRPRPVVEVIERPDEQIWELELADGTRVKASADHSWPTSRGHIQTQDLTTRDIILQPHVWDHEQDDSTIYADAVRAEVERLCAPIVPGTTNSPNQFYDVAPFIEKLSNARLVKEFLQPFTERRLTEYARENGKSIRREVSHPSESVARTVWEMLRRVGVHTPKPRCKSDGAVTNKITLSEQAYTVLYQQQATRAEHEGTQQKYGKWDALIGGLMTGDGSALRSRCTFCSGDPSTISLFSEVMRTDFGIELKHHLRLSNAKDGGAPHGILTGNADFRDWLKERGLHGKKFDEKRVPQWVKDSTPEVISYFLSGCFMTDGTIYLRQPNPGRNAHAIICNISHANKELVEDYVELFAKIGINARCLTRSTSYNGEAYPYWSCKLTSKTDIVKFFQTGLIVGNKRDRFNEYFAAGHLPSIPPSDKYVGVKVTNVRATAERTDMRCLRVKDDATFLIENGVATCNSTYASRSFAQWIMGRNPDWRVLSVGHSQKFTEDEFSKPNRGAIDSDAFRTAFPDVMLNPAEKSASFWRLDGWRGSYACRGALAGTSGLRAKIVLADDLFKNAQDALSPVVRENIWRWWTADVMSRRLPNAPTVLVNTLWFSEDVPGRIKRMYEENPDAIPQPFEFINIPAQAGVDDPLGREEGEWLWCIDQQEDGFYHIADYISKRDSTTPALWSALYQGEPLDKQGDYIAEDQFQRYDRPPMNRQGHTIEWTKTVMSVDCAAKGKERSDYTVILIFRLGVDGFHYLVDVWRKKETMEQVVRTMAKMMRLWQVNHAIVEDSGMGAQILENYAGKMPSPMIPYVPAGKGSKDFRFDAASVWITSGKVLFPKNAPWIIDFISELVAFPNGANDDQVDAFSQYTAKELKLRLGGTKPLKMRI